MNMRNIVRSDFSQSVLTLISGTTIAQFISIAISPILSRLFTPAEFGLFATFAALIGLLALFAGARYEVAILLPKEDKEAANITVLSLLINILYSIGIAIFIFCFSFFTDTSWIQPELMMWIYLTPVFVFFIGIAQSMSSWNNRQKKYRKIAEYRIANSAIINTTSMTFGYMKLAFVNGLITSYLIASVLSVFVFFRQMKNDFLKFKNEISRNELIAVAKKYKRFPYVNSFQALSDTFQVSGVIYFVSCFFDVLIVGVYSFAIRILMVPMNFAGSAFAQVFYQHATELYNKEESFKALIKSTILKSLLIVIPVFIVLVFFGPSLFAFVFGDEWKEAGVYAQILAPWVLLDFIRAPLSQIPIIIGKQNRLLYFSFISNVIVFSTMLYTGMVIKDIKQGFVYLSVFQSVYNLGIIIWFVKLASVHKSNA